MKPPASKNAITPLPTVASARSERLRWRSMFRVASLTSCIKEVEVRRHMVVFSLNGLPYDNGLGSK